MPEGIEQARAAFAAEVAPRSQPRDVRGQFVPTDGKPEPMFGPRPIEGDPVTGDTRDAGDDARLRAIEREVADGRLDERQGRRAAQDVQNVRRASADDGHEPVEAEPGDELSPAEDEDFDRGDLDLQAEADRGDAEGSRLEDADAEKYEVTVDGALQEVSLQEALRGYVRQATFHKRIQQLNGVQSELEADAGRLRNNWNIILKAKADYEQDLANLIPQEPNWDQLFAANPQQAHETQKIYQALYGKLHQSRQQRAEYEAWAQQQENARVQKYAIDGFSKFVMDNKIPDEPSLQKELKSMRRTAADAGFSEQEVATVYDPRMLTVLRWASKYRRILAATRPRAVIPGKGRTLTPGAATPLSGNAPRKGLDDALRRQASSGRLDDTAEVFRRLL